MTTKYPTTQIIENILGIEITDEAAIAIEQALFGSMRRRLSEALKEKEQNSLSFHTIQTKHQEDIVKLQTEIMHLENLVKVVGEFVDYDDICQEDDYLHWDEHWNNLKKAYLKVKKP